MPIDPRDHNWDKELERGPSGLMLPDCRLKPLERENVRFAHGRLMLDQVYCAECHQPYGGVTPNVPHVFYICQQCVYEKGAPPDIIQMVPGTEKL